MGTLPNFLVSSRTLGKKRRIPYLQELCLQVVLTHHSATMLTPEFNMRGRICTAPMVASTSDLSCRFQLITYGNIVYLFRQRILTGKVGIEPTTCWLTVRRSTTELQAIKIAGGGFEPPVSRVWTLQDFHFSILLMIGTRFELVLPPWKGGVLATWLTDQRHAVDCDTNPRLLWRNLSLCYSHPNNLG